ncbi:MAG: hypothetical protein K1000chlam1_01567 [Candidatus Anoxychlamydiales bacterium]|nr:hypothetical protein [Candidatus Anoxychlamydiales bacterium]
MKKRKSKNLSTDQSLTDIIFHITPVLIIIFVFEIVAIQMYISSPLYKSWKLFFLWIGMQAIGSIVLGYISDKKCRKTTLIFTQISAVFFLIIILFFKFNLISIALLALSFNPSPIARAATIDNFPSYSKVKLIAITFIAQFLPWSFYLQISKIKSINILIVCIIAIIINIIITVFLFKDKRDIAMLKHPTLASMKSKKLFFTIGALLPAQIVFFLADSFFEGMPHNAGVFSALGVGSLVGTLLSLFYRKVPHISFLTICYGIGVILAAVTLFTTLFLPLTNINLSYQLMMFSTLGGFYLPFLYDVILSSSLSTFRGTACGMIDGIISLSAIIGLSLILILQPKALVVLIITTLLFSSSTILQKIGEKK